MPPVFAGFVPCFGEEMSEIVDENGVLQGRAIMIAEEGGIGGTRVDLKELLQGLDCACACINCCDKCCNSFAKGISL